MTDFLGAKRPLGPCPRPCSECPDGHHHWLEQCTDDDGNEVDPYFACKHCDAKAGCCDECAGPIFPAGPELCGDCIAEQGDFN